MEFEKWEPFYHQIVEDFEYDEEEDFNAGKVLSGLIEDVNTEEVGSELGKLLSGAEVYIFGGGPSLARDIPRIFKRNDREPPVLSEDGERPEPVLPQEMGFRQIWVAADIATTTLLNYGIIPNIIITDLDGIVDDHLLANEKGAFLVIHAHGDNIDKLKEFVPKVKSRDKVLGTMQTSPEVFPNLVNFGGFTDGDRGVYLGDYYGTKSMLLVAFNFRDPSRKRGVEAPVENDDPAMKIKAKKLTWANVLIAMLDNDGVRFFDER